MMLVQDGLVLPVLRLLAACIGAMLVTSCLTLLFRPALIGWGGEKAVRQALARLGLPALHDVVLADTLGHAQIDHLVRTAQGIMVIETKAFAGWITGTLYGAQWVQHLAGSRIRHGFQNPVRQNHRHCKAVEVAIGGLAVQVQVHSLVVSAGRARYCEALEAVPMPVAALGRLVGNTPWVARVDTGEMAAAWTRLEALARRTPELRRLHRAEVRVRRLPEQVLTARMAWALLPVGVLLVMVGVAPMCSGARSKCGRRAIKGRFRHKLGFLATLDDGASETWHRPMALPAAPALNHRKRPRAGLWAKTADDLAPGRG